MKNKASLVVKHIISVLSSMVKPKIMGVKSKADAMRVRLLVFSLLKGKKFSIGSITNKIQALLEKKGNEEHTETENSHDDQSKALVLYDGVMQMDDFRVDENTGYYQSYHGYEEDEKYPDLTHFLFDEGDEGGDDDHGGSVIDIVKNSKENEGEDFKLEDEIDEVADLFIKRVRKHMRLEKLESFKRYQAMLGRGAN